MISVYPLPPCSPIDTLKLSPIVACATISRALIVGPLGQMLADRVDVDGGSRDVKFVRNRTI